MSDGRLPTGLWVDAVLTPLNGQGLFYYIHQKGNHGSGVLLLKLNGLEGKCRLITQQRDLMSDEMVWVPALSEETAEEKDADVYIAKATSRDPDLWVIEIEDRAMNNPFAE